jgi:hypothetical protein
MIVHSEESQQDFAEKSRGRVFADEVERTADGDKRGRELPDQATRILRMHLVSNKRIIIIYLLTSA